MTKKYGRVRTSSPKTIVVLPDAHVPFEDKKAVRLALEVAKAAKPDEVILLGDVLDFYSISRFDRDPTRRLDLAAELEAGKKFLANLRKTFPRIPITFLFGNHEDRLRKYLWSKAPELASLPSLQLDTLLGLEDLNIDWRPYGEPHPITKNFVAVHGSVVRSASGASARGELQRHATGGISGHVHRLGAYWETRHAGSRVWIEAGCLCDVRPDYVLGTADWQQGIVVLTVQGESVVPEIVQFQDGSCYFRGQRFAA